MTSGDLTQRIIACTVASLATASHAADAQLNDKTLVAWVSPGSLTQQGGGVLSLDNQERCFDGIVFGEIAPGKWMAGSDNWLRSPRNQAGFAAETAAPGSFVQITLVYEGKQISAYRDGELYSRHEVSAPQAFPADAMVLMGKRHLGPVSRAFFAGSIDDARIYDRALTEAEIKGLQADSDKGPPIWAWWTFDRDAKERTGRFAATELKGGAKLANGRLVLDGRSSYLSAGTPKPVTAEVPTWPANPPANWMTYHLAHPGPGDAHPGDPNCAVYWKGRYHLHYIYKNPSGYCFAHVSSEDMVTWKWHPTTLGPDTMGHGMHSGTGFFTKEGRPAIVYHGQGAGRNFISIAEDDLLEKWSEPVAIEPTIKPGQDANLIGHWDPDLWLDGDTYYATSGAFPGANPKPATLFRSKDLKNWDYLGRFIEKEPPGVQADEDVSCPNFFKIGNKWMLLCISHNLGCRYYLGDWRDGKFTPESHHRMNWTKTRDFFAPESLLTPDGRRVMWAWQDQVKNARQPQSGIQSLPRELSLPDDGVLRIKPLRELDKLRTKEKSEADLKLAKGESRTLAEISGSAIEIALEFNAEDATRFGAFVYCDASGGGGFPIAVDLAKGTLKLGDVEAPLSVPKGEAVKLRIYLDERVIEIFANDIQVMMGLHVPQPGKDRIRIFSEDGGVTVGGIKGWTMKSIYEPASAASKASDPSSGR